MFEVLHLPPTKQDKTSTPLQVLKGHIIWPQCTAPLLCLITSIEYFLCRRHVLSMVGDMSLNNICLLHFRSL